MRETNLINGEDLTRVLGGNTTHVIVHGREHRDRLLRDVNTREDRRGLGDTGETLMENLGREMAELEVDVVLIGTNTTTLADLDGHRARDDVTRGEILRGRCVTLHEALTLRVQEVASLTTGA
jgi:hypothetical protein